MNRASVKPHLIKLIRERILRSTREMENCFHGSVEFPPSSSKHQIALRLKDQPWGDITIYFHSNILRGIEEYGL
jgi:hypothetical protein